MGRQEMGRKVYKPLKRAGLDVLVGGVGEVPLPVTAVGMTTGCGPETGRRDVFVAYQDTRLVERLNAGWQDLAAGLGLFGGEREFLVALPARAVTAKQFREQTGVNGGWYAWRRVRLMDRWDIMGAGAATFLGIRAGHPGFAMLSLDGSLSICCTTGEIGVSVIAVPHPGQTDVVRDWVRFIADPRHARLHHSVERAYAAAWLDRVREKP